MLGKKDFWGILLCANALMLVLLLIFKGVNLLNFGENSAQNSQKSQILGENLGRNLTQSLNLADLNATNSAQSPTSPLAQSQNLAQSPALPLFAAILNYEFAFFICLCIIVLSFASYKKSILSESKSLKIPQIRPAIFAKKTLKKSAKFVNFRPANDEFGLKFSRKFAAFFSLAKLASYGVLAFGFYLLSANALLDIAGFICGVSSLLIGCFIYGLWVNFRGRKAEIQIFRYAQYEKIQAFALNFKNGLLRRFLEKRLAMTKCCHTERSEVSTKN